MGMLVKCLPDALRNAAMLLAVDDHRIKHLPKIIDHHVAVDRDLTGQRATSQVLQVISSSPGNLKQVFATMLENATRICEAKFGALYLSEGNGFRATAMHNAPPAYEEARAGVVHPPPSTSLWRAANTKQAVQIADVTLERGYIERDPFVVSTVALGGYRSVCEWQAATVLQLPAHRCPKARCLRGLTAADRCL